MIQHTQQPDAGSALERQAELWDIRTLVGLLKVARSTIYQLIDRGEFPAPTHRIGRRVLWRGSVINQHLNRIQAKAG